MVMRKLMKDAREEVMKEGGRERGEQGDLYRRKRGKEGREERRAIDMKEKKRKEDVERKNGGGESYVKSK